MCRVIVVIGWLLSTLLGGAAAQAVEFKVLGELSGDSFLAVAAAIPEVEKKSLSISGYRIVVSESGDTITVSFIDPTHIFNCSGNCGPKPGLEVVLQKSTLQFVRSHSPR